MTLQRMTFEYLESLGYTMLPKRATEDPRPVQLLPLGFLQAEWSIFVLQWPAVCIAALVGRE